VAVEGYSLHRFEGPSGLADVGAVLQVLGVGVPGWDHHYLPWVTEQVVLLEQRLQLSQQQLFLFRDQLPAVDQKLIDGLRQAFWARTSKAPGSITPS
jgi:hypothetical protein